MDHPRAEILNYRSYVCGGHDVDSETVNVSARQAMLKRLIAIDKRWNRRFHCYVCDVWIKKHVLSDSLIDR